ncbi:MAG TPA: DNA polymerase III subunit delta' [Allosphingosinicella sp.]|nr:DNA polymerase III subunit delta' [Allosphingosinicella sp.]
MTPLYGHEAAIAGFRSALDSGKMHHAWLLAGPEGVGKALFADKAALRMLADGTGPVGAPGLDVPDEHPAAKLVAAGSHPDLMRLERLTRDGGTELARSISVDQVRGLQRLFATTSSLSPRRAVVIDAIDDLERNAANALLKNLEEPPPDTLFLLVSHSPERLLPTIRSRCRLLRLAPLAPDAMTSALRAALPDADAEEIEALVPVGEGAPGRAIAWRGLDIAALDREMEALVRNGDRSNARRAALAGSLALKSAQGRYEAFLARMPSRVAAEAKGRGGQARADAIRLWEKATSLAGSARRHSLDPQSVVFELAGMLAALSEGQGRSVV